MNKKIKLALDARPLSQAMNGVTRYVIALLKALPENDEFSVYLFSDTPLRQEYKSYYSGYPLVLFNRPKLKKFWKNWILPLELFKNKIDLYHSIWDKGVPALCPCPVVMSIHDLYTVSDNNKAVSEKKKRKRLAMFRAEASTAKKIITCSEYSRKDIAEKLGVSAEKISVTYYDCDRKKMKEFVLPGAGGAHLPGGIRRGEYFVSVVGRMDDARKNIPFIINSFAEYTLRAEKRSAGSSCDLVLVGSFDSESQSFKEIKALIEKRGISDKVIMTGYVNDEELYALVSNAIASLFVSIFEGFGMPILEAFFLGTPVITANTSSMPEIASQDSAILVDPTVEEDLVRAMESICVDQPLRESLVKNGLKRLEDFSWNKTAGSTVSIYKEILMR